MPIPTTPTLQIKLLGKKSEITYDDTEGKSTQLFRDRGLSEVESWFAAPPKYCLEVKTTTEEYDAPSYISKG